MPFTSNFDVFRKDWTGGARARSPKVSHARTKTSEDTYAAVRPLMQAAGMTRVADVTGLDRLGIPVVMVARPNSRGLSVAQGKGADLLSAKVSGVMEALESFHAERLDIPVRLLSWNELAGTGRAVDPSRLPQRNTSRFNPDTRIAWGGACDLVSDADRLIPLDLIHTDFASPPMPGGSCFPVSSNGLASGNTYAEAVCQGLCELIERDAFALFRAAHAPCPSRVDLTTSENPDIQDVLARIEHAGAHLSVYDLTSDIGVPVFFATITGGSDSPVTAMAAGGLGCHPDRTWGCLRAVYEAAQSRLTRLAGARDDLTPANFRHPLRREEATRATGVALVPLEAGAGFSSETVEDDLCWLIERLEHRGLHEVLVTDLGRPDFCLPVVRVVVPGLEPPPSADIAHGERARRVS
ncbi:YcaO-like family protein [Microvirga yunnanensis]|uniref:YcaO-like family protein n=1 Tax=Microvirga yunnanensis TaxID=2953740 RepID=UPI0021C82DED|nr:YcaO-like family protein [Microvirga sp. HBU65207]